jgi:hypothetical protein
MDKVRVKVLINWYGEVLTFYTYTTGCEVSESLDPSIEVFKVDKNSAVLNAISQLSKRVGVIKRVVKAYVLDSAHSRWEVKI